MKYKLSKKDIYKLTHCPLCDTELEDYALLFFIPHSYCPKCDILKTEVMSLPWLCSKCDSKLYVNPSDYSHKHKSICFLCKSDMRGIKIKTFHTYKKKDKIKRGYFVSNHRIPKKYLRNHPENHLINTRYYRKTDTIFYINCTECDYILYYTIAKWRQKELGIDKKDSFDKSVINENEKNN